MTIALRVLDSSTAVGRPLRVQVVLTNSGPRTMYYDAQGVEFGSFMLEGPVTALQIAMHGQTFGHATPLAPAQSVMLLENYDLAAEYLIDQAGEWRVKFVGPLFLSEREGDDRSPVLLASDWRPVRIDAGRPAPWMEVARRLADAIPSGWRLSVTGLGSGVHATIHSPEFVLDRPFKEVRLRIGPSPGLDHEQRLCGTRWGEAFMATEWPGLEDSWPGCQGALRAALSRP